MYLALWKAPKLEPRVFELQRLESHEVDLPLAGIGSAPMSASSQYLRPGTHFLADCHENCGSPYVCSGVTLGLCIRYDRLPGRLHTLVNESTQGDMYLALWKAPKLEPRVFELQRLESHEVDLPLA